MKIWNEGSAWDAKLSASQRKKLKASAFCGPNRSFPANDCAHVRAGFRLLNRAKVGSSTKAKIRACLNRKNKSMGCGVNAPDASEEELETIINSEAFEGTLELVAFLESIEEDSSAEEQSLSTLRDSCTNLLAKLRHARGVAFSKDNLDGRSLQSLLDSIADELDEFTKRSN